MLEYGYPIRKMCAKLCIAASSYYKWLKRKPSKRQLENEDLTDKIKDMFYENDCVFRRSKNDRIYKQEVQYQIHS